MKAKKIKGFTGTWTRGAGTSTVHHFDSKQTGKRVDVMLWKDTGEIVVRAIKGDGRHTDFVELESKTFPADTPAAAVQSAVDAMSDKYFK